VETADIAIVFVITPRNAVGIFSDVTGPEYPGLSLGALHESLGEAEEYSWNNGVCGAEDFLFLGVFILTSLSLRY
jgi:hypothetical protein